MAFRFEHDNQLSDEEIKYIRLQAKKFERHDEVLGGLIVMICVLISVALVLGILLGRMSCGGGN